MPKCNNCPVNITKALLSCLFFFVCFVKGIMIFVFYQVIKYLFYGHDFFTVYSLEFLLSNPKHVVGM